MSPEWLAAIVSVVGVVLGALQVTVLFILSDLRERIMRLESNQMQPCHFSSSDEAQK
jgi:hypothetical protein